jgi:hypothetical protein
MKGPANGASLVTDRARDCRRFILAGLLSFLATQSPAATSPPRGLGLPPADTPVFCLDNEHVYQPLVRTSFARLWNNFQVKLGLIGRARGSQLIFRGGIRNAETITYAIERHEGGIALLNMRVRLYHLSEDRTGTDMCQRTFTIINGSSLR